MRQRTMRSACRFGAWAVCALSTGLLAGCQRESRDLRLAPPLASRMDDVALMQDDIAGRMPVVHEPMGLPYTGNAYQIAQGKRLYEQFNCNGCHAQGGGSTGPALIDGWWAYGPQAETIYKSIRDGRPNGMPAFKDKLTTEQMWQLAGYVQKIGAYTSRPEAPGRNDEMQSRPGENRTPAQREPLRQGSRR